MINLKRILTLLLILVAPTSFSNQLLEKAKINAGKFQARGMPTFISMDANEDLIQFAKPQTNPYETLTMKLKGTYTFVKDKERKSVEIVSVLINWGDGSQEQRVNMNGADKNITHKYSNEGTFKITLELNTLDGEYFEYARAVSNTEPDVTETSGRVQPQKVIWREDCLGTYIDGKCYEIITTYTYTNPQAVVNMVQIGPATDRTWATPSNLSISGTGSGTYWRTNNNCVYSQYYMSGGRRWLTYTGDPGCVTKVEVYEVCYYPYYRIHGGTNGCRRTNTTYKLLEEGNVPASMYRPSNMEYSQ